MYLVFSVLAAVGLAVAMLAHVFGWMHVALPRSILLLHAGVFLVWFPMLFGAQTRLPSGRRESMRAVFRVFPGWVSIGVVLLFIYGMGSFLAFLHESQSYGKHHVPFWLVVRGFSGVWMIFFAVAFIGLVALQQLPVQPTLAKGKKSPAVPPLSKG